MQMLGKEIGHQIGQQSGMRVLRDAAKGTGFEVSYQAAGTLLGVQVQDIATYDSWLEPDGSIRGSGQGVIMGDGGEMASWEATGVGHRQDDGSVLYRGSLYYRSSSPKFSKLTGKCAVFEFGADPGGKTEGRLWLWE
jgi:hypothetical protein